MKEVLITLYLYLNVSVLNLPSTDTHQEPPDEPFHRTTPPFLCAQSRDFQQASISSAVHHGSPAKCKDNENAVGLPPSPMMARGVEY